ncbi:MAG TPA: lysylphosphatidylglycerol synthase transmembrane domain-containing protein [Acidimicrobiales bacterium]|nr:lysylphosphatidylglycerol synthase transmembrane domain-containing protein [Acidimicrobiales bacterium]
MTSAGSAAEVGRAGPGAGAGVRPEVDGAPAAGAVSPRQDSAPADATEEITLARLAPEPEQIETHVERRRRVRAASDVLRLLGGLALVALGLSVAIWAPNTVGGIERDVNSGFARLPDRFEEALVGLALIISVALPIVASVVLLLRKRYLLTASLALAAIVASVVMDALERVLADRGVIAQAASTPSATDVDLGDPGFATSPLIASTVAIVVMVSPRLPVRWRRACWAAIFLLVVVRIIGASAPPLDVIIAIGVGMAVGALALVAVGAPSFDPDGPALVRMLRRGGIEPVRIVQIRPIGGQLAYRVWRRDLPTLVLRLRTPHDRSADLLERLWRRVRYKRPTGDGPLGSMKRRIEREALAAAVARAGGVRVPALEGVVADASGSVGLALEDTGARPLSEFGSDLDDDVLDRAWKQLSLLHWRRIAHRDLDLEHFELDADGRIWLVGLDRAAAAASDRDLALDVAQLLVDSALAVGPDRAVHSAYRSIGPDAVRSALPYLQPLALPASTRTDARRNRDVLTETRVRAGEMTATPEAELERLDRVRTRTLVTLGAVGLAFYVLLPQLADLERTADAFRSAHWGWLPAVVGSAALTFVFAAVSFMGSVPSPLRFWPTLRAQIASAFVGRITPGSTGGLAVGIRYLQRSGDDPGAATASVGLNALAGLAIHLTMMVGFFAWTGTSGIGGFSLPDTNLIFGAVAIVLSVGGAILVARPLRERLLVPALRSLGSAAGAVGAVATSPLRVTQLTLGSAGVTLAYIASLTASIQGFGGGVSFPQIGAAYLGAAALATASPTPGGLGALEAGLIAGLSGFGMDDGAAVSAVLTFRLATYWVPTLPGWVAFHWMERRGEL